MTAYVAGFLFDPTGRVALIRKRRGPAAVVGRLNGIGGHIEPRETPVAAMVREFREEAGIDTGPDLWGTPYAALTGPWGTVHWFRAWVPAVVLDDAQSVTDEHVYVLAAQRVLAGGDLASDVVPNLSWLLPLALYTHDDYEPVVVRERAPAAVT